MVSKSESATVRPARGPHLAAALAAGLALILAAPFTRAADAGGAPILVYHRFDAAVAGPTTVTMAAFEAQLAALSRRGYRIVPLRQAVAELAGTAPRPASPFAAITVDDGHRSVYSVLFPAIRKARIPVTLFVYPSAISNAPYALTWPQLREMQASGLVDVESHTYWHPNFRTERRRRTEADYRAFVAMQLGRSRSVLERELGKPVDQLAWPFGIVDPDLEAAARAAGYHSAFAYAGGPAKTGQDLLALPRIPVTDADRGRRFETLIGADKEATR
ncbi:MAG TPA: polysaccharide deacetylase family protein [Caulobacteraceae bacterium]|nr:polysaccharide deacetylase family protein [Caulobacteraceae bacterium]